MALYVEIQAAGKNIFIDFFNKSLYIYKMGDIRIKQIDVD
jgi:hypothetical protein